MRFLNKNFSQQNFSLKALSLSTGFFVCLVVLIVGCGKDVSQFLLYPSTDSRVGESLSGTLSTPATVNVNSTHFKFAVFADPQIRPENKNLIDTFKQDVGPKGIDFFVVLGDLTEDGNSTEIDLVQQDLNNVGVPYFATIGNHDLYNVGGWQRWKSHFGPATYSVTIAGKIKIILLDTASGTIGARQFAWLETELKKQDTLFTIVGSHYPINDGTVPLIWRLTSYEERMKLIGMLNKYKITAYVAGHTHGYKYSVMEGFDHFIIGTMYPYMLDYGQPGYVLFDFTNDVLTWERITF